MRSWKINIVLVAWVAALAGLALGQEQGPVRESGPAVARPKKAGPATPAETELPKIPSRVRNETTAPADAPIFRSDVEVVTVDVAVLDNKGHFIPGIPGGNFRILEDNVPQQLRKVDLGEAPMKVAMVIEFSNLFQSYWGAGWYQTLQLAWGFAESLKPEDYCAVVAYDMHPEILTDFTTDKSKVREGLERLKVAAWSESNLFDAITDTADRMSGIEGRKAIVLIASGIDTLSKLTFDKTRKSLQQSGVPIYAIGLMQTLRELADARGQLGALDRMSFLQADNAMRTFAKETGGTAFFPRFEGEFPNIFQTIHQALRNQYVLTYAPSNKAHDGAFRKIKVELVNPATNEPLAVKDEKGKPIKYSIVAKAGYTAPRPVE
jgi:Ca-activated chloride channel homolog